MVGLVCPTICFATHAIASVNPAQSQTTGEEQNKNYDNDQA